MQALLATALLAPTISEYTRNVAQWPGGPLPAGALFPNNLLQQEGAPYEIAHAKGQRILKTGITAETSLMQSSHLTEGEVSQGCT